MPAAKNKKRPRGSLTTPSWVWNNNMRKKSMGAAAPTIALPASRHPLSNSHAVTIWEDSPRADQLQVRRGGHKVLNGSVSILQFLFVYLFPPSGAVDAWMAACSFFAILAKKFWYAMNASILSLPMWTKNSHVQNVLVSWTWIPTRETNYMYIPFSNILNSRLIPPLAMEDFEVFHTEKLA